MSTEQIVVTREHYLNVAFGWKSWLLTTDHKRIGLLFLISITFFFFLGGAFATLIRLELMTPQGDLFQAETYNKLFSMHGIVMVFFFLIPSIPAVLGNFLIPLMIGARDLAFPRLNLLSWYLFVIGGVFTLCAIVAGGVDTGWTFYTPYSSLFSNTQVVADDRRHLHRGLFVDSYGTELHRYDSQDARAGNDLVPAAAVHLVALCDGDHQVLGTPGCRDHTRAGGART